MGDPMDDNRAGPLAFEKQLEKYSHYVKLGFLKTTIYSAAMMPTLTCRDISTNPVLTDVNNDMNVVREESSGRSQP